MIDYTKNDRLDVATTIIQLEFKKYNSNDDIVFCVKVDLI